DPAAAGHRAAGSRRRPAVRAAAGGRRRTVGVRGLRHPGRDGDPGERPRLPAVVRVGVRAGVAGGRVRTLRPAGRRRWRRPRLRAGPAARAAARGPRRRGEDAGRHPV
ncbi:MAG: hypothetical protein AVDCRST_MAG52-3643, partial [uncultured Blastococcus sp.]